MLLNHDPNIISKDETCLFRAIHNEKIVKILLEYKPDLTALNWDKKTILHVAIDLKYINIIKMLLNHGINPNIMSKDKTYLFHAINNKTSGSMLLDRDTDLNIYNTIIKMLLDNGADPNVYKKIKLSCSYDYKNFNSKPQTPLQLATDRENDKYICNKGS